MLSKIICQTHLSNLWQSSKIILYLENCHICFTIILFSSLKNLAHQPLPPVFKSPWQKLFFQLLWIYFHMFIHQFIQFFSKLICQLNSQFLIALVCLLFFSLYINHHALLTFHFFLYCHYPYTYHTISESHFPYIYPVSLKIFIYCILERVWKRLSARCASQFVGYFARMRARSGLRQLNSGEISRKVGRADCGNDFSDTL